MSTGVVLFLGKLLSCSSQYVRVSLHCTRCSMLSSFPHFRRHSHAGVPWFAVTRLRTKIARCMTPDLSMNSALRTPMRDFSPSSRSSVVPPPIGSRPASH